MEDKDLQEQLNELQIKHESLIREYCNLMDENRKLKGSYNTHLKGKDYLNMNESKEDLKMQVKVLAVYIIISLLGMIGGMFLVDKAYYSTGIIITLICFLFFVGCIKVSKKVSNQLENKD
jgi:chromosome segregation ATPase